MKLISPWLSRLMFSGDTRTKVDPPNIGPAATVGPEKLSTASISSPSDCSAKSYWKDAGRSALM